MYMMWQLSSLPFCCCSRIKQVVVKNTHFSSDTSAHLTKSWPKKIHIYSSHWSADRLYWRGFVSNGCLKRKLHFSSSFLKTDLIQLKFIFLKESVTSFVWNYNIYGLYSIMAFILVLSFAVNVQKMSQFLCCLINLFCHQTARIQLDLK